MSLLLHPDGQRLVTRVELRMSDGTTHIGNTVPNDIFRLVTSMPPVLFDQGAEIAVKVSSK